MSSRNFSDRPNVQLERTFDPPVEDLWELWTTKEGFESWWGPQGFRVAVHTFEPRAGGALSYDMIAVGAAEIAEMKKNGQPLSHATHGVFLEVEPHSRIKIRHVIDFLPGVEPYETDMVVEFIPDGGRVRMVITISAYHDELWTRMATEGMASQLTKLPGLLEARRAGR